MAIEKVCFSLESVLDGLSNIVTIKVREKGLKIHFLLDESVPRNLIGDPLRLEQVLWNLTNNAVKFTERGKITVHIKPVSANEKLRDDQIMIEFSVEDTGIGLSVGQVNILFQSFTQADTSTTREYGGTGLGLAISKQLVQLMDGNIWVESEPGRGSRFVFTATFGLQGREQAGPLCTPEELEGMRERLVDSRALSEQVMPDELEAIQGARILVVEDNAINQQIIREVLEQAGLVVIVASNGKEGVQKVNQEPFDAVLMDLQMPIMDGYALTRSIREDARFDGLPIIAMTAHVMVDEKEKCLAAGMNGHTPKPIDLRHLFALLRQWIKPGVRQRVQQIRPELAEVNCLPIMLPGIDVAACLRIIGGNQELLNTLLLDFRREFSGMAKRVRKLLDQGDIQEARQLTHRIKGTSGNLSVMALYDAASQLDEALLEEAGNDLPGFLDAFETTLDEVMLSIASLTRGHFH